MEMNIKVDNKNKGTLKNLPAKSLIIFLIVLIGLFSGTPSFAALSISGNTSVCLGSSGATWTGTYTLTGIQGNPQYFNWVVPSGATIIAGAGTAHITVMFSSSSTSGAVVVNTAIGTVSLPVRVYRTYTTVNISGEHSVCRGQTLTYSVPSVPDAVSYGWNLPSGATLSSYSGNSVAITYSNTFSGGTLKAYAVFATCGIGPVATLIIARLTSPPGSAGNITGNASVCPGAAGITYSVPVTANATGYSWTLPNGATIVSGANTNHITVNFPGDYSGGTIRVRATNCVGNGPSSSLAVTAGLPQITTQPVSPPMICEGSGQLSISVAGNNITSYQWYEGNSPLTNTGPYSGVNTSTLTISNPSYSLNGKKYKVLVNGSCGYVYSNIATISVGKVPVISQQPVSLVDVCDGAGTVSLGIVATSDYAFIYQWYEGTTPLTNNEIYSGAKSQSLSITNPAYSFNNKQYKVMLTNVCGSVTSTLSTLRVNKLPTISISGNGPVRTGNTIDLAGPSGMATYLWTGPNGFSSTVSNPIVTENAITAMTGTYTLTCTDPNGCSNTGSTALIVNGINTSLPVGSVAGSANVSQSGAATYQVPITVSPGTDGMRPNISVLYNSLGGDGLLGRGWNLSGISAITRVPNDIYHDGSVKEVNFDANDKFALDGQRLIATNGTYGANNTEYHTEIESFAKTYSYGTAGNGPAWFKVMTKGGTILEFGNTPNSRIEAQGRTDVLMWYLNKVTDPLGNYMVFTYHEDHTNGEAYVEKIEYTGNETTGLLPYCSVNFYYQQRTDPRISYIGGSKITHSVVLSKIVSLYGTAQVREYDFNYSNDLSTRLKEITEKGEDGTTYNSTVIDWGRFAWDYSESIKDLASKKFFFADFNGDGRQDYISYADKESYSATDQWSLNIANADGTYTVKSTGLLGADFTCFYIADFNGDGMDDLLKYSYLSKSYKLLLSNGNEFVTKNSITFAYMTEAIIGDFDGNGLTDCLFRKRAEQSVGNNWEIYSCNAGQQNNMTKKYYYQNGYSFPYDSQTDDVYLDLDGDGKIDCKVTPDGKVIYDKAQFGILPLTYLTRTIFNHSLFDYNANGKTDIKSNNTIIEFNGQGFSSGQLTGIFSTDDAGDFNGDGITDFMGGISGNEITIYYGTGTLNYIAKDLAFDGPVYGHPSIGDFNGDGLSDVLISGVCSGYFTAPACYIALSNGTGFTALNRMNVTNFQTLSSVFLPADINGDELTDFIFDKVNSTDIFFATFSHGKNYLMVRSVSNGLNQKTEFEYKPLTDASVYTKGSGAVFPIMDYQGTSYVVSSMKVPDGIGGKRIYNYTYSNAKIHRQGQGFLGYMQNTVTNVSTNTVTKNTFDFDNAYNHVYLRKSETTVAGNPVSESGSSLAFWSLGNKRYLPYTSSSYNTDKLTNTTVNKSSFIDINGNLLSTSSSTDVGSSYKTFENYNNLGQPGKITTVLIKTGDPAYVRVQEMTYYPNGLLQQSVTDPGKAKAVTTNYTYDFTNHLYSTEVSAAGLETRTSSVKYDNKNRFIIKKTNSLGQFTEATYDEALGVVKTSKDINGLVSTFTYDAFGRQTETLVPDGTHSVNTMAWCNGTPSGALYYSQTVTTGSPTVKTYFDFLGRTIKSETTGFDGRIIVTDQIYNNLGQKYKSSEPYFQGDTKLWSTNTYDIYGRLVQTQAPNSTVTISYSGKTVTTANATTGQTTSKTMNSLGQLESATDEGGTIVYSYFSSGKPKTIITNGSTTSMEYDDYGNQTKLTDPNTGTTNYSYDAYGELISQTDTNGNTYALTYDKLGRVLTKTGPEGITSYTYDTEANGIGALASVTGPDGINISYQYDNLSRPKKETQVVDGTSYITGMTYTDGKLSNITYPSGFGVNYAYNSIGYLEEIKRADNNNSIWKAEQFNALGQMEKCLFGNGLRTAKTYDAAHFLKTVQTTNSGGTIFQNMEYGFDPANGNLLYRKNNKYNLSESFTYDVLNRLKSSVVTGQTPVNITYQPSGNIDTKSGLGTYTYGNNAGPHALTNVENTDGLVSSLQQDITYTSFNKAATITENSMVANFKYAPDLERREMTIQGNGTDITRIYIGNYEKEVNNGNTRELHYIGAYGETVAVYEKTSAGGAMYYVHPDHLGSLNVVTDEQGNITEEQNFDAWGRRRNPQNWTYNNVPAGYKFYRGFTGHEQLDQFGLINMNGRMYDPAVGRFLSADNVVQAPDFTQSYNRYSYCLNNPLKYTDPSGWEYYGNPNGTPEERAMYYSWLNGYRPSYCYQQTYWSLDQTELSNELWMDLSSPSWDDPGNLEMILFKYEWYSEQERIIMRSKGYEYDPGKNGYYKTVTISGDDDMRLNNYATNKYGNNLDLKISWKGGTFTQFFEASDYSKFLGYFATNGGGGRHSTPGDLWNIFMGGAGTLADVTSNGFHNSIYWVQKNGKVTLTKNMGNNYLLQRSNRIVGETLQNGKMVAKSLMQINIAYSTTDYALTWATTGNIPSFGQGMDLFFTSVAAIPGAGWAVSGGYWIISAGSYAFTGKWMSEHMDDWVK